jgi:hypothetical protein
VNFAPRTLQWVGGLSIFRCQGLAFLEFCDEMFFMDRLVTVLISGRGNRTWIRLEMVEVVWRLNEQQLINPTSEYSQVKAAE